MIEIITSTHCKRESGFYSTGVAPCRARVPQSIVYTIGMRLLVATTNPGKMTEIKVALSERAIEVLGLDGFPGLGQPEETGATFAENALVKARFYHGATGLPTVADDSGLEVEALGGRPGIHSARYAGPLSSDRDRINKLLLEMNGIPPDKRAGRFVCAAALAWSGGEIVFHGEVHGSILEEPRGNLGFGYDPVFYHAGLEMTLAEMTPEQKASVSHRGIALGRLADWIKRTGLD